MSATTSRGSRSGATAPAMAHRDSPGWTVTDTVGVSDSSAAESAALAGELRKPLSERSSAASRISGSPEEDEAAPAGQPERRLGWARPFR